MVGIDGVFVEIGFIVVIAAIGALILKKLKQPQLLAYVLVGLLITPIFKIITNTSFIESISTIGIAFLLFIVGLEMDIKSLKSVALVSTFGGLLQILILFIIGYFVAIGFGLTTLTAVYLGLLIAFSSTMVVMKLLSDKRQLQTLHGKIIVGTLFTQDLIAIFALSILISVDKFNILTFGTAILKFLILFLVAVLFSKFVFPKVFKFAAKYQELLLITSLGVCFLFSLAFQYLGFSVAIGAFIAGIALGNLEYRLEIIGKIKSLKDFFSLLFFVSLGMIVSLNNLKQLLFPLFIILVIVLILKPIIIMFVCSLFKFTKKPSFFTANALAQIGEFSLILATQGFLLGHLTKEFFSMIILVTLITITLTSYYIKFSNFFFNLFQKPLRIFDKFTTEGLEYITSERKPKIVLVGYSRIGYSILKKLHKAKKQILIVDFNPEIIAQIAKEGFNCIYGDVSDDEILERMNLENINIIVSTIPETKDNLLLIRKIRTVNKKAKIFVTAQRIKEALKLYQKGADYVLLPHFLGGEQLADIVSNIRSKKIKLKEEKENHIKNLEERQKIGHEHPDH